MQRERVLADGGILEFQRIASQKSLVNFTFTASDIHRFTRVRTWQPFL